MKLVFQLIIAATCSIATMKSIVWAEDYSRSNISDFIRLSKILCSDDAQSFKLSQKAWAKETGSQVNILMSRVVQDNEVELSAFFDKHFSEIVKMDAFKNITKKDYISQLHLPAHLLNSDIAAINGQNYMLALLRHNETDSSFYECHLSVTLTPRAETLDLLKNEFSPSSEWGFKEDIERVAFGIQNRFFVSDIKKLPNVSNKSYQLKIDDPYAGKSISGADNSEIGVELVVRSVGQ